MNVRTRLTGNLNLVSETGNIYLNTSAINRFRVDPSGNIYSYGNFDVSGNIKGNEIFENSVSLINKYATIANLNLKQDIINCVSPLLKDSSNNITIGTLPVSFGGTGTTTFNEKQILIGNGTNALLQSPNLIWDNSSNGLGIGTTELYSASTTFQVKNRRIWIESKTSNNSISILSTDKYGSGTSENYIQLMENVGTTFRGNESGYCNFRFGTKQAMTLDASGTLIQSLKVVNDTVCNDISTNTFKSNYATINNNLSVLGEITANTNLYGANATSKSLIKFQTKLGANSLYYYNLDIEKYYKTGQNINGKNYKVFNLTSWAEDGFSIINKCTVYTSSEGPGIKYIMFL